jgi:hypothetical protein
MKKIYSFGILFLLIVFFFAASCKKEFLDQKPTSALTEADYFQNLGELETGLVACYAALGGILVQMTQIKAVRLMINMILLPYPIPCRLPIMVGLPDSGLIVIL